MNPYSTLSEKAFWKTAVATKSMFDIDGLWEPKFPLQQHHRVVTFGSCFAQHIGKALLEKDYKWFNTEPSPPGLSKEKSKAFNYNIFSSRTGNIYTASLLKQWVEWALEIKQPPEEYWENNGRIFDPFRPNIEPNGFETIEDMRLSRLQAIKSFRQAIEKAHVFVFTLGLTESWFNSTHDYEYPMCPGTVAGEYDPDQHQFKAQSFGFISRNLLDALKMMRTVNHTLKVILTVSPVPLTATNTGKHVLSATMESKSILRAVAGQLATNYPFIDYFPSYEIINGTPFKGAFFEPNQRSVNHYGVSFVMESFFKCLHAKFGDTPIQASAGKKIVSEGKKSAEDIVCEEELLAAFGKGS